MSEFDRQQAEETIQSKLVEMNRILNEDILPLARKYSVEFQFLDLQYHLFPRSPWSRDKMQVWNKETEKFDTVERPPAPAGLLVSDDEWESSTFGCSTRYWDWYNEQWPEGDDE